MTWKRVGTVVCLGVTLVGLSACGGGDDEAAGTETTTTDPVATVLPETGQILRASVGPGFEISLTTDDGQPVETLPAGSYTLFTNDQSDIHNFHLTGEGVDVDTGVAESGTSSFDVDLSSGTYDFVCDPHAGTMNGSVEVSG
jgi:hypothetical protein